MVCVGVVVLDDEEGVGLGMAIGNGVQEGGVVVNGVGDRDRKGALEIFLNGLRELTRRFTSS